MKPLKIAGSQNIPNVDFNHSEGMLVMKGRSILENTAPFFEPIINWVEGYCKKPAKKTEFHIEMDYFNTSSSKFILSIFEKLQKLYELGQEVEVFWYYCEDDSKDLGKDYSNLLKIPFRLVYQTDEQIEGT